jgi:hypothetical protein
MLGNITKKAHSTSVPSNTKSEARISKWFGQLTILNQVEGQILMIKIQITQNNCFKF